MVVVQDWMHNYIWLGSLITLRQMPISPINKQNWWEISEKGNCSGPPLWKITTGSIVPVAQLPPHHWLHGPSQFSNSERPQ